MKITQFLHTAILVSDLAKAEFFYGEVLGLTKVSRDLKYPGAWYEIGNFQIHLIVNDSFKAKLDNPEQWGRNRHLAVAVADVEEAKAQLTAHNCPFQMSRSGRTAIFTQDPDGNVIEIS